MFCVCACLLALLSCAGLPDIPHSLPQQQGADIFVRADSHATSPSGSEAELLMAEMAAAADLPLPLLPDAIRTIRQGYLDVNRRISSRGELVDMKFALLSLEEAVIRRAIAAIAGDGDPAVNNSAIQVLTAADAFMTREELSVLQAAESEGNASLADVLADQAILDFAPRIPPSRESRWDWQRIQARPELTIGNYPKDSQGRVLLRGAALESGDILMVHLKNPSEGLFTAFAEEPNYSYHAAMYIELAGELGVYPLILESYEMGLRVVPAASYFRGDHTAFIEVLRWPDDGAGGTTGGRSTRLAEAVARNLGQSWGFNITLNDDISLTENYISCVTTLTLPLGEAGYPLPGTLTGISAAAVANFARVGTEARPFITPSDFLTMDELSPVAIINNRGLELLIAASLANNDLNTRFERRVLAPDDGMWRLYRSAVRGVQNRRFLVEPVILGIFGYSRETFPLGTPDILALVLRLEEEIDKAVLDMEEHLMENRDLLYAGRVIRMSAVLLNPVFRDVSAAAMTGLDNFFE